jgi:Glycosyl hydrolases family 2, sugar binding domain
VEKTGQRLPWDSKNYAFLTPEVINTANTLFDAAEKSVQGNDELVRRVRLQRAAVYLAMVITASEEDTPPAKGLADVFDKFLAISDPSNNNFRQEGSVMSPSYRQYLKDISQGKPSSGYDVRKASESSNYSDEKAFAEMRKTMTEVFDFPKDGWKFKRDKNNIGSDQGWFKTDFDDSAWRVFSIGKLMEEQIGDYDGIAWYRLNFTAPAIEPGKQIFMVFGAVDDSAKVWLNGKSIGEHEGWDRAFALDVTQILKQGQTNFVAVKVMDDGGSGGIWKSVKLMVK